MKKILYTIILLLIVASACKQKPKPDIQTEQDNFYIADFNADSAYAYIAQQTAFGPRVPNTPAHKACADYLIGKMQSFSDTLMVQDFTVKAYDGTLLYGKNIIACFHPEQKSRILLGAHWDSRPYADHDPNPANHRTPIDGANDGASGVGVLMEIARQLSIKNPNIGIDIIFFDVEDYGAPQNSEESYQGEFWCLGSQHWAKNQHVRNYNARFGILLDMVGGENAVFTREGTSNFYAPDILNKVWNIATRLGYSAFFKNTETPPITDDHLYINRLTNIPMIDIIEYDASSSTGFNRHWHTLNDNLTNIDKNTLLAVGKVTLTTVYNEK